MRWNSCQFVAVAPASQRFMKVRSLKLNRYLSSLFVAGAALLIALPAQAAKLQTWGFNAGRNQLEFKTDVGVQPKAQLINNPTRLVIDLPGVIFGRPQTRQPVNSPTIRSLRVGQFEKNITRIVLELEPGYTIDPGKVKFKGTASGQWTVAIPTPQRGVDPTPRPKPEQPNSGSASNNTASTQIQRLQVTGDGLFLRTSGQAPQIQMNRSADKRRIEVDLAGASISPGFDQRDILVGRHGIRRAIVSQRQGQPPIARLSLIVDPRSPDWRAAYSESGGVILLPTSGSGIGTAPPQNSNTGPVTTIQDITLTNGNQQLAIVADNPMVYTAGWDRSAAYYKVTIQNAKLDPNLKTPRLGNNSPLLQVRLRQETPQTVAILMAPAAGVTINSPVSTGRQSIALSLSKNRSTPPPVTFPTDGTIIPVPPTVPGGLPAPTTPIGRSVVVIDPGHGGRDPGAVGRGGIQEKEIVLDISRQVASILAQSGVQAIMTRNSDIEIDLQPRVNIAERAKASLFVSIHANAISMSRPDVNGLETYYYQSGLGLAQAIHSNVLRSANVADRRVRQARFYVLRRTSMPSVLVETGFVTGATDAANFGSSAHRQRIAQGIANGILQYLRGR